MNNFCKRTYRLGTGAARSPESLNPSFRSRIFPRGTLEFVHYEFNNPSMTWTNASSDMTFAAPLKLTLRLVGPDIDEDTGVPSATSRSRTFTWATCP